MRRTHHSPFFPLALAVAALVAVATPAFAAPPFGSFGGQIGGGNAGAGVVGLFGWALDDEGVAAVDIYVDGVIAGRAAYGRNRPGVEVQFPGFPDSGAAGWSFALNTTRYPNGLHTVTPEVLSITGERTQLPSRTFEFLNTTHNLVPFGETELPAPNTELYGTCDPDQVNDRRLSVVSGYALDVGIEIGDTGVGYVELLIDGSLYANTRVDCRFDASMGGLTDCYGLRRLDIERAFPDIRDAPHSGFRFVLDVGRLIELGYVQGFHVLSIRSGDVNASSSEFAEIPVTFLCDENLPNEGAFGEIDLPPDGLLFNGTLEFTGWALDWETVDAVIVYVDGNRLGDAVYGIPRPGVTLNFPGYPDSDLPGWAFNLDSTQIADGTHQLQVVVRDLTGATTLIAERTFEVSNP